MYSSTRTSACDCMKPSNESESSGSTSSSAALTAIAAKNSNDRTLIWRIRQLAQWRNGAVPSHLSFIWVGMAWIVLYRVCYVHMWIIHLAFLLHNHIISLIQHYPRSLSVPNHHPLIVTLPTKWCLSLKSAWRDFTRSTEARNALQVDPCFSPIILYRHDAVDGRE